MITSRDNQRLKEARKVREGRVKDLIFIEGLRLAEEVSRTDLEIKEVFYTENFVSNERGKNLIELFTGKSVFTAEVSGKVFNSLADTKSSQGVVVICRKPETGKDSVERSLNEKSQILPIVILLHKINNPTNLGAILRTAEAAGVSGVITTRNSADVFSPKAIRGAMGAVFRLPIWSNANFFEVLNWSREKNLISTGADVNAVNSYTEIDWKKPRLLIFGSEAHGFTQTEFSEIEENLLIPMENQVESLNLGVSCGIILFEAKKQFSTKKKAGNTALKNLSSD